MLEETLKLINQNLERIANALEPKSIDAVELPKTQNTIIQTMPESQAKIVQSNDAPSIVTTSNRNMQASVVPVAPVQNSFTQEQLAVAMSNAVAAGKMQVIQNILQQLGVQALTQVKPEDYNKLATMLKEQGVEV